MPGTFLGFLVFFVCVWLLVTTILSVSCGWFRLARRFPDQSEKALLQLNGLYGNMGAGVRLNGILKIGVCPSGLRIGISRIFGPFDRDLFVPWDQLLVERVRAFLTRAAALQLGIPQAGRLILPAHVVDRLIQVAGENWPEKNPPPPEPRHVTARRYVWIWLLETGIASGFFIIVPRIASKDVWPPIWIAIAFPAVVIGIATVIRYFNSVSR